MTTGQSLLGAIKKLEQAGIGTARLDALVLLEYVTGQDRALLLAEPNHRMTPAEITKLNNVLSRRAHHEPIAYIIGSCEFYGRSFLINSSVLQPRPESETMIDLLKQVVSSLPNSNPSNDLVAIADVGTGCGALGITASLELPKLKVDLVDIDKKALKIAQINVDKYTMTLSVIESNLLDRTTSDYHILMANLPYVPDTHTVNQAARYEPPLAIFGGHDGLAIYRRLFRQVAKRQNQPLYILTECLPPQHDQLSQVAAQAGYKTARTDDFINVFELAR